MKKKAGKLLKNGGLFAGLLLLTFYLILKDNSIDSIVNAVSHADVRYMLLGVAAMCLFQSCEALNIARSLRLFGYQVGPLSALKYAVIGFFFSAVTPSSSGGQPMQVYCMHRDRIDVAHSTLALLFELLSFVTITVLLAIAGFIYQWETITASMGNMKYLLLIGIGLNAIVMVFLVVAIFTKKTIATIVSFVIKLVERFSKTKGARIEKVFGTQLAEYQRSARYFKENKVIFVKTLFTSLIQLLAMYSVPFLIYKSFGLSGYTFLETISLQAVLYVAVSALPLPGALGVSESGFMVLFKTLFPAGILGSAMVLSRGISFYLFVLISGISVAIFTVRGKREVNHGLHHINCRGRQRHLKSTQIIHGKQRI